MFCAGKAKMMCWSARTQETTLPRNRKRLSTPTGIIPAYLIVAATASCAAANCPWSSRKKSQLPLCVPILSPLSWYLTSFILVIVTRSQRFFVMSG